MKGRKPRVPTKAMKKEIIDVGEKAQICVGCQSSSAPVDLHQDTQAEILFANRWADSNFACVSCAFHGSLMSQLRCSLLENIRRPPTCCLVCRSSGHLVELCQVEGADQALSHPVIGAKAGVIKLAVPSRKVCTSCAYALQWLYKQSLKIYVKASKSASGTSKSLKNLTQNEEDENEIEEKEGIISNGRTRRLPTRNIKTEPVSPPVPAKSHVVKKKPIPTVQTNLNNGKTRTARQPKKKYIESESEESDDSEEASRPRRKGAVKPEVLALTRSSRRVVAPNRYEISNTQATRAGPSRTSRRERIDVEKSKATPASLKRKSAGKPYRAAKRQAVNVLTEHECDECSQIFYSGVSAALHKLEHEDRYFKLQLERCATPVSENSSSELEDDASTSSESKRKPRKPDKPRKNAARDRLNNDSAADSNFVFVAPLRVSCPKSVKESKYGKDTITYGFEKPINVTHGEKSNEFSDDEEETSTENVDNCISSLENSENQSKSSDENASTAEETEKAEQTEENKEKSESVDEDPCSSKIETSEATKKININQALSFDFEAPEPVPKNTSESNDKISKQVSDSSPPATKSNCLKFDFEEPVHEEPKNKPVNSILSLSFDFEPPVSDTDTPKKSLSPDKSSPFKILSPLSSKCSGDKSTGSGSSFYSVESEATNNGLTANEESSNITETFLAAETEFTPVNNTVSMLSGSIDTSHALRDDSSNPTLPQSQPREPDTSFSFQPVEQNTTDMGALEKMVSEVVGHN